MNVARMSLKEKYVKLLNMQYLEGEGGYFVEIYRANDQRIEVHDESTMVLKQQTASDDTKQDGRVKQRDLYTTIYYLIEKIGPPHSNLSDHIHFFHDGAPVKYYWLDTKNKKLESATLGRDIEKGHQFQLLVPGGTVKWAVALDDGVNDGCALISECVMPGFEYEDRTMHSKEELQSLYPEFWDDIKKGFH